MAYVGKFFVKNANTAYVSNNGETSVLFGKVIPPYTKATRYWVHQWVIGADDVSAPNHMEYRTTGLYDIVPNRLDQTENLSDISLETYQKRYFAEGISSGDDNDAPWGDADDGDSTESDVDLTGGEYVSSVSKSQRFFHHEKMLGLPRNAMFNGVGNIRFVDEFTRKGTFNNTRRPLEHAKMCMIVMGTDEPVTTTDDGDHLWGDHSNMSDLSEALTGIHQDGTYDIASGMDNVAHTYPNIDSWLKKGMNTGGNYYSGEALGVITKVTLEVKAYTPHNMRSISAP